MPSFHVVVPVFQSAPWIGRCIASLRRQTHRSFRALVLDDASEDGTYEAAAQAIGDDERFVLERAPARRYQLANRLAGIRLLDPPDEGPILLIDGDDWLLGTRALARLAEAFADPAVWLTYGSYRSWKARLDYRLRLVGPHSPWPRLGLGKTPSTRPYPAEALRARTIRALGWRAGHPLAFRRFLWDAVRDEDLRDASGDYLRSATDVAAVMPMLEMAGPEHVRHLPETLYVYNRANPLRRRSIEAQAQKDRVGEVLAKPPYAALER